MTTETSAARTPGVTDRAGLAVAVFFLLLLPSLLLGFPLGFLPLLMPSSSRTNCQALHGPTLCFVASVSEYDLMFPDLEA